MPQTLRSVLAVLAGFLSMAAVVIVLTLVSVHLFHLKSGHPTPLYLTLNIVYSLAAALLGGYVAARLARRSPVAHGMALAALMLALSLLSFKTSAGGQPFSYRVVLVIAPPLAAIAGASLRRLS